MSYRLTVTSKTGKAMAVIDNRVLRKKFGAKREEVTEGLVTCV